MRMLFVSFSGLLLALFEERVQNAELAEGLFYFGCTREHAFLPSERNADVQQLLSGNNPATVRCLHNLILLSLGRAEAQERVRWRSPDEEQTYEGLNELLGKHGYAPVWHSVDDPRINFDELAKRVEEAGLPLKVISRYSA